MEETSITSEMVNNGIKICRLSIQKLKEHSSVLAKTMEVAFAYGWQDRNREKIEQKVNECVYALEKPVKELENCESNLYRILNAIAEYEDSVK